MKAKTLSELEDLFTIVAPKYEIITRILSFGRDQFWKKSLIQRIPYNDDQPLILDIATGTGDIAFFLHRRYTAARIIVIDLIRGMLLIAKKRLTQQQVLFGVQEMTSLGVKNNSFDIITGGYALRNSTNLLKTLQEVHRTLKPSGHAAFLDFSKSSSRIMQNMEYVLLWIWGAVWGFLFHGKASVYTYLARSLKQFPDRKNLQSLFECAGFEKLHSRLFFFGIVEIMVYRKIR